MSSLTDVNFCGQLRPNLIDATRISDGTLVYIKRVSTGGDEVTIATYFSQDALRDLPYNHCVPVLETLQDDLDPSISYIVMPYLRLMNDPEFTHVDDVVDFVDQTIEVCPHCAWKCESSIIETFLGFAVHASAWRSTPVSNASTVNPLFDNI